MDARICVCLMVLIMLCTAGCTHSGGKSAENASVSSGGSQNGTSVSHSPPPADIAVSAQINEKDRITNGIMVLFSGGPGQNMVRKVWGTLQAGNGAAETFTMLPKKGYEADLTGSNGDDTVRVYAEYYSGDVYLIGEKVLKKVNRS